MTSRVSDADKLQPREKHAFAILALVGRLSIKYVWLKFLALSSLLFIICPKKETVHKLGKVAWKILIERGLNRIEAMEGRESKHFSVNQNRDKVQ